MQELQPQLAELLRTCIHPPSLRLQVVHVNVIDVSCDRAEDSNIDNDPLLQSISSAYRYATKLVLSDGQLMVHALLHRRLSTLGDVAGVSIGDLLEIKSFQIKRSSKVNHQGQTIYLAIQDCHLLKEGRLSEYSKEEVRSLSKRSRSATESTENTTVVLSSGTGEEQSFYSADESIQRSPKRVKRATATDVTDPTMGEDTGKRMDKTSFKSPKHVSFTSPTSSTTTKSAVRSSGTTQIDRTETRKKPGSVSFGKRDVSDRTQKARASEQHSSEDEADFFELAQTSQNIINQRRQALRDLELNVTSQKFPALSGSTPKISLHASEQLDPPPPPPQLQETQKGPSQRSDQLILQPPPPFHTLRSLRNPPVNKQLPPKSYTLTTLGFITWAGSNLIHRPGSPFPPKRHLKIIDPSLSPPRPGMSEEAGSTQTGNENNTRLFKSQNTFQEAVTLAVYLDAGIFKPPSGTLALFRGVVMQRLTNGDIILNVYARLKDIRFDDGELSGEPRNHDRSNIDNETEDLQQNHTTDNHWFITDHNKIRSLGFGSRLDYYMEWWRNRTT